MRWLVVVLLLVLGWLYSRTLPEPHPCDVMLARDGAFADVEGCKQAFEVGGQKGDSRGENESAEGGRPLAEGMGGHDPVSPR
ncbi:MAG: hypothetical protein CMM84_03605 [Rhodothermaceae bacterium]|nr:hypothetical protein [Rhodothermaceae bacterium]MBC15303.1 hypothetical protein [Rhodothermaceae bacterium]